MAYDNLNNNLDELKKRNVVPKSLAPEHLNDFTKQAINDLTPDDLSTLEKIANTTQSHIYVSSNAKDGHLHSMVL